MRIGKWPVGRVFVLLLFYYFNGHGAFNEVVKDYGHCDAVNLAGLIRKK
jgi:hypothetical protein